MEEGIACAVEVFRLLAFGFLSSILEILQLEFCRHFQVSTIATGDRDGQDFANAFQNEMKKRNVNVVDSARFNRGDTSQIVQQKVEQVCARCLLHTRVLVQFRFFSSTIVGSPELSSINMLIVCSITQPLG